MTDVTITDVARHAQVGIATVSRVLNGTGSVSPEMRERILASAKALGYVPNPIARTLKAGKTKYIAYVTTSMDNITFADIARGLNSVVAPLGYTLCLLETNYDIHKEISLVGSLVGQWVDGIVLLSSVIEDNEDTHDYIKSLSNLRKKGVWIPVVHVAVPCLNPHVDAVIYDHEDSAHKAVAHMTEIGRRNIAYISVPKYSAVYKPRMNGYLRAMEEANLSDRVRVVEGGFSVIDGYKAMCELLEKKEQIDGVFAGNDGTAVGVIAACKDYGVRIPEDIAIIGNDDTYISSFVDPQLSTVRVPRFRLGKKAGELLFKRLTQGAERTPSETVVIDTEVLIRGSTLRSAANKRRTLE